MSSAEAPRRRVIPLGSEAFLPYDRYGEVVPGLSWVPLSEESKGGGPGCYAIRFAPGASSQFHLHSGIEEFYVLEGELVDNDDTVFKTGDFVSFEAGTQHSSHSPGGCVLLVFLRLPNRRVTES